MNMAVDTVSSSKLIPIELDSSSQCPYIGWYRFQKCTISTCKNFSAKTRSSCLALDREAPVGNKIISDAELNLYKYPDAGVSTRLVSMRRKKAVARVKSMLALNGYIAHLRVKHGMTSEAAQEYRAPEIGVAESAYPLRVPQLQFKNWMWKLLISDKEYEAFTMIGGGECADIELHDLLSMTRDDLESLRQVVASKVRLLPQ